MPSPFPAAVPIRGMNSLADDLMAQIRLNMPTVMSLEPKIVFNRAFCDRLTTKQRVRAVREGFCARL